MFHDMFTRGEISCPGELSLTTIFPSKKIHNKASSQQVKFVMIRIEFIFSRFKSILLGASGEGFRKQTKEGKSLFTLRGLVSCDANKTSSELPLEINDQEPIRPPLLGCVGFDSIRVLRRNRSV